MKLILKGTQRYWFHEGLIAVLRSRSDWGTEKIKDFLSKNDLVHFNDIVGQSAKDLLNSLEQAGFQLRLEESKSTVTAVIGLSYEKELESLRKDIDEISSRLHKIENSHDAPSEYQSVKQSEVYQRINTTSETVLPKASEESSVVERAVLKSSAERGISESSTESNIGQYWLSKIGIFTLVLGIVLFISYSFQFIGPLGKIIIGAVVGASLIGAGNYLAEFEKYKRWAMAAIGGGWATLYFTVFAAYQIPATRVIHDPFVGFLWLLAVIIGSISQSLKFRSAVLVFFSYFLGFIALTMVEISLYTLLASFLLGVSIVIVTKKMGWTWLSLLGLVAIYLTHYLWVSPSLVADSVFARERLWDVLVLPWVGGEWIAYPLIPVAKSILHQAFLILYWLLFTAVGFFEVEKKEDRNMTFSLLLANSFVFVASYIHHLHVYYPALKYLFPLIMGAIFFGLSSTEQRLKRGLLSDLYLSFSVSLFALAIPMYFDGSWITYGWAASFTILSWLGIRHQRVILYRIGWILAGLVFSRLICFDYLERDVLFNVIMPVRASLPIFAAAGLAFLATYRIYRSSGLSNTEQKNTIETCFFILGMLAFGFGFLVGGFRAAASVIWILQGILVMLMGISQKRYSWRIASAVFICFAAFRIAIVDCAISLSRIMTEPKVSLRLAAVAFAIILILALGDWMRRKAKNLEASDLTISRDLTIGGALLVMVIFYDAGIRSWISIVWGITALAFIVSGFALKDKIYRWCGLGIFAIVLWRLFTYDFAQLETIYRIISFIGLGGVFIAASFLYSYYSKMLLENERNKKV